jgi:ABC-type branched-subunit amino acid transport system substrate-binding protein
MFKLIVLTLALLWLPAPAPAQEGAPAPATFLLAVPNSGPLAELGSKALQGAELALGIWGGGFRLEVLDENRPGAIEKTDLGKVALVLGYFTESRFAADAPRYLYLHKPVLLPFLTNDEAAGRGPGLFFRLMPTAREQGRFLALEILKQRRRPGRLLLITGTEPPQAALVETLTETLAAPANPALKPLDANAQVITISLDQALEPEGLAQFGRHRPDMAILALDRTEALKLVSPLARGGYGQVPLWGTTSLGFRDVGAAFTSLNLDLRLCLPAVNLADQKNPNVRNFTRQFIDVYKTHPTWVSALAFDSLNLAIKAASSTEDLQGLVDFLTGRGHHGLTAYDLSPESDSPAAMTIMPVKAAELGFLP